MANELPTSRPAEELSAREAELQAAATMVLEDLDAITILSRVGEPVLVGSVALGLMVWPDIDLTVLCPALDMAQVFAIGAQLAGHERVRGLQWRNDTGHWNQDPLYPDGLFWGVEYRTPEGERWELDIWFIHEDTRQPDMRHLDDFLPRLDPETRLAIMTIKDIWRRTPLYGAEVSSFDCYTAVLDHGVRTPEQFQEYLDAR